MFIIFIVNLLGKCFQLPGCAAGGNYANTNTEYENDATICIEQINALRMKSKGNWGYYRPGNSGYSAVIVSITVAVTSAEEAATELIMANVRREMGVIEDVGNILCSIRVENQKLTFEIDRLEQYSRRENVRIYGLRETQGENTSLVFIDMAQDIGVTITPADISVNHRLGRPGGSSTGVSDSKPRPLIVKPVRRQQKRADAE